MCSSREKNVRKRVSNGPNPEFVDGPLLAEEVEDVERLLAFALAKVQPREG